MSARTIRTRWSRTPAPALALLILALLVAACDGGGGGATTEDSEETCRDGVDNDADGRLDCLDPTCRSFPFCVAGYDASGDGGGGLVPVDVVQPADLAGDQDGAAPGEDAPPGADACQPLCAIRECGDDGCGGSCGTCPLGQACLAFECEDCEPTCAGKECGDDGCGGECGPCLPGRACQDGICVVCTPDCAGKDCGPDGCGGECGTCNEPEFCYEDECTDCVASCAGKECGSDGCDGTCGSCQGTAVCDDHTFQCVEQCLPNCAGGRECGPDGCGGSCGDCTVPGEVCHLVWGDCRTECVGTCLNGSRQCGTDGCGGTCGTCEFPLTCNEQSGRCEDRCIRQCLGKECGDDGCGGRCDYCPIGQDCDAQGQCFDLPYNCPKILQCVRACPDDDAACVANCRATGQAASATRWDSLKACMDTSCPGTPDQNLMACLAQSCSSQLTTCNLDLVCGDPGTDSCMTVSSCFSTCADAVCINNCLCRASQPAYDAALAYAQCLVSNCPSFDAACMGGGMMNPACAAQWLGCFAM